MRGADMIQKLKTQVLEGYQISKIEALSLLEENTEELALAADEIRQAFCGNHFDLCAIINAKSGRCSENCQFCAQSSRSTSQISSYPLLSAPEIAEEAVRMWNEGVPRFSIVTSGRALSDAEVDALCEALREIGRRCPIALCVSGGLLTPEQFQKLKEAGASRYHCNLEASSTYFSKICTTHTYEDKIRVIGDAVKAGLTVCSGGILGLGESVEDRLDLAFALKELGIRSVPVNILNPIQNTPLGTRQPLEPDEVSRTISVFRFILPDAFLRLAGGRALLPRAGADLFRAGANAAITGDMLTTDGAGIAADIQAIADFSYQVIR